METSPILLDSSILIDFFRKRIKSKSVLFRLIPNHEFYISVITAFEIEIGLKSESQQRDYSILREQIELLPIDHFCIQKTVEIYKDLREKNALVELADLLIAATAISNSLPLATLNQKHFKRISNISLIDIPRHS